MTEEEKVQGTGIVFGNWKLIPCGGDNWELAHLHVSDKGKNAGRKRWYRTGRFYQFNTFHMALRYAAHQEMAEGCTDAAIQLRDAINEYERIVIEMTDALRTAYLAGKIGK